MPVSQYDVYPEFEFLLKGVSGINNNLVKGEVKKRFKKPKNKETIWNQTVKLVSTNNVLKQAGMTVQRLKFKKSASLSNLHEQYIQLLSISKTLRFEKMYQEMLKKQEDKKTDFKHVGLLIDLESLLGERIDVERLKSIFLQQNVMLGGQGSGQMSNESRKQRIFTNDLSSVPEDKRQDVQGMINRLRTGGLSDAEEISLLNNIEMNIPDIISTKPSKSDLRDLGSAIDVGEKGQTPPDPVEEKVEILRYAGNDHLRRSTYNFDYNVNKKSDEFVGNNIFRRRTNQKTEVKRLRF